ncbi:MAG: TolC family protein [Planctomycetota bacterium]
MSRTIRLLTLTCLLAAGCASKTPNVRAALRDADSLRVVNQRLWIAKANRIEPDHGSSRRSAPSLGEEKNQSSKVSTTSFEHDSDHSELRTLLSHQSEKPSADDAGGSSLEGDATTYTLAEIEGIAVANNPTLSAAQALVDKSDGLRYQVGRSPNPLVGYFGQQIANRNTDQHGVFVEQEFVRGNKLELNQRVLGHTRRAQDASIDAQRYRVLTDVRVRFFEAMAAQQRLDTIRDFLEVAGQGLRLAKELQAAEEGTLVETLQAETLFAEITLAEEQEVVAFNAAWQDLCAVANIEACGWARLVGDMPIPDVAPDWNSVFAEIVAQSPELAAAHAIVCEKSALYRRQQAQIVPNVITQLGAGYDETTEHGMINAMVSAPIPVWNKNRGNVQAAYADYVRATQEVSRLEQSIRSRLSRTSAEFESALRAVSKYEEQIIPQVAKSLALSEAAYRVGELGLLQVLVIRRSYFESNLRLINARGRVAQATSKIDGLLLSGGLEAPVDFNAGVALRDATFDGQ